MDFEQLQLPGMENGDGEEHEHEESSYDIPPAAEAAECVTAFLVIQQLDGSFIAMSDINAAVRLQREPTLNDMYLGGAQVQRDANMLMTSARISADTVNGMLQAMAAQMEAAQNAKIAAKLASKGIHVPR